MASIAAEMGDDLQSDVKNHSDAHRVVFLGRDGHSLAIATAELYPEFFNAHCSEVVLSRAVVDSALQDLEKNYKKTFPNVEEFRGARKKVSPENVDDSHIALREYLRNNNIPVGKEGSSVTLVDTSFKGTVQELLSAAYPNTEFTGRYAFYSQSPEDPHPGTKIGYVFHQEVSDSWKGLPKPDLPNDVSQTFGNQDALGVIEETMHGPLGSPKKITGSGPTQTPQRHESNATEGINPILISPSYQSPDVREAVKAAAFMAVQDTARDSAQKRARGEDWKGELMQKREHFTQQVRLWVEKKPGVDTQLKTVLDSFVRRADKGCVKDLANELKSRKMSPEQQESVWERFRQKKNVAEKEKFVATFKKATESSGDQGKFGFLARSSSTSVTDNSRARIVEGTRKPTSGRPTNANSYTTGKGHRGPSLGSH
ncbi:ABC transporter permease [Nocardiopsis rhodophaea]